MIDAEWERWLLSNKMERKSKIMLYYYVNTETTYNPNHNHEVHTENCPFLPTAKNREPLGYFYNGNEAVDQAKLIGYWKADGCAVCCPEAHKA